MPCSWVPSKPFWSIHTSSGGIATSAASNAMATFRVTMMPKSRSSGSGDRISTANPPMVVIAEVKNARPVRLAAMSVASRGARPAWRSSR